MSSLKNIITFAIFMNLAILISSVFTLEIVGNYIFLMYAPIAFFSVMV